MVEPTAKFLKSMESDEYDLTPAQSIRWLTKLIYEFWGYVINGGDDPVASGSGFAVSGGMNFPTGFTSGTSLLTVGIDGRTSFGSSIFTSQGTNFTTLNVSGTLPGKYLVMWKSGSTSTDDGIYKIKYVESDSQVVLDVRTGGTPRLGNRATFWDRSDIRFRVIDIDAVTQLAGWADQHGMTLQFDGSSDVNRGQRSSQFHFQLQNSQFNLASMSISPSGSWNNNYFIDSGSAISVPFVQGTTAGRAVLSLAGGKDFLSCHFKGIDGTLQTTTSPAAGAGFHVEIPRRMYPAIYDPNPITFMAYSNIAVDQLSGTYASGFRMVGANGVQQTWTTLVRSPFGDRTNVNIVPAGQGLLQGLHSGTLILNSDPLYNPYTNQRMVSDGLLHLNSSGQFSLARARLRRVRFSSSQQSSQFHLGNRYGSEWIHFANGILWPWNNTDQPYGAVPWEGV